MASPYEGSAQCRATSETTRTWKTILTIQAPIRCNKANMKGWLWRPNYIQVPCGPKASRHLSYRWGKTPKKFTYDTCPDRVSNPDTLHDRRACYRMLHSGEYYKYFLVYFLHITVLLLLLLVYYYYYYYYYYRILFIFKCSFFL